MGFGSKFKEMIGAIYLNQKARIIINGETTENFRIMKGVRQGCPMSPLLFILTMEVLLNQIRQRKDIIGLKSKKEEYKVQAFADDLVFFLEDPMESGTFLIQELEEYGMVAGLKINTDKTKVITKKFDRKSKKGFGKEMGII
uniref:Reverse transcriptase domain-containing protein n=1 Tax=Micrurus surinamensis TaxID=129470 RepID=A0A2D4PTM4_MICSU